MPSKMVNDRRKLNRALRTAIVVHEAEVLEGLRERLEPFLGDGAVAGFAKFYRALTRFLASRETEMVAADEAVYTDRLDNRPPIRDRNKAAGELRTKLLELRRIAAGALGAPEGDELLALEGAVTEDPLRLHQQGVITLQRLRDPELPTPPLRWAGMDFDRQVLASALEPSIVVLGAALEAVEEDRKLVLSMQEAKNEAMKLHDDGAQAVAGFLTFVFRLGGKRLIADRLKPITRRRPRLEDVEALVRSPDETVTDGPEREDGDRSAGTDPPANTNEPNAKVA